MGGTAGLDVDGHGTAGLDVDGHALVGTARLDLVIIYSKHSKHSKHR